MNAHENGRHINKHNNSETHWSMSSVSQAVRKQQRITEPPSKEEKKKVKSRTFILSESLVLVDYDCDRVLALGGHCGTTAGSGRIR